MEVSKRNVFKWWLIVVFIVLAALAVGMFVGARAFVQPQSIPVSNLFVDIDGNGQLDLLVSGEVILNSGSAPLAAEQ